MPTQNQNKSLLFFATIIIAITSLFSINKAISQIELDNKTLDIECGKGDTAACTLLGRNYRLGINTETNIPKAVLYLQKGCNGSQGFACNELAALYEDSKSSADIAKALPLYQKSCDLNFSWGCLNTGSQYIMGALATKDLPKGEALITKACELKNVESCFLLGRMYDVGESLPANMENAKKFYNKACDLNDGYGCYYAGSYCKRDEACSANYIKKALPLLIKECDNNKVYKACKDVSLIYESKIGTKPDITKSQEYLDKANKLKN